METLAVVLPVIAGGSVVCVTGLSLYFRIRHKFPVTVNCWFCNKDTDVPYGNRDCWDCPHCDQYNGFLPDGGYNKAIPAQHDELLNHPVLAVSNKVMGQKLSPEPNGNGLCRKCNLNQELKVQQLASFTPVNPANYDEEVDRFRHHLERAYRLCSPCEEVLKKTLHKQKSRFLGLRLKQSRNNNLVPKNNFLSAYKTRIYQAIPSRLQMFCYFTTLLAAGLVLATSYHLNKDEIPIPEVIRNQTIWSYAPSIDAIFPRAVKFFPVIRKYEILLTAAGAFIQFMANPMRKHKKIDLICISFWLLLHIQCWLLKWNRLEKYISLLDFNITHVAVAFITLLMCTFSALIPRKRFERKYYNTPKKARHLNCSSESFESSSNFGDISVTPENDSHQFNDMTGDEEIQSDQCAKKQSTPISHSSVSRFLPVSPTVSSKSIKQIKPHGQDIGSEELDHGLGNLTLGTKRHDKSMEEKIVSSPYGPKVYGQSTEDIFDGGPYRNLRSRRTPIIKPSQLNLSKNITQSSWVAGGYWQSPTHGRIIHSPRRDTQDMHTGTGFVPLSRSSSQSSGFVSQSSQTDLFDGIATSLPNSRTGSVCGADFDRFSALSEPIYHYATTPVYFTGGRPSFYGAPFYGGTPLIVPHSFGMMPPGFVPQYPVPQPRPALAHSQPLYAPPSSPLSPIWNPSAFSSSPPNKPHSYTPADVQSQSSSQDSDECYHKANNTMESSSPKQRTLVSTIKEKMFLAVLFGFTLLINALISFFMFK